ncbi:hypothetical protein N9A44_00550 [Gammaproteobacteria bacterium]|nr:hypothetical protein [Gammaproteobacteria bacterium]
MIKGIILIIILYITALVSGCTSVVESVGLESVMPPQVVSNNVTHQAGRVVIKHKNYERTVKLANEVCRENGYKYAINLNYEEKLWPRGKSYHNKHGHKCLPERDSLSTYNKVQVKLHSDSSEKEKLIEGDLRRKEKKERKAMKIKEDKRKLDINKAGKTCLDLGFKKGTKKYKNCIIELL